MTALPHLPTDAEDRQVLEDAAVVLKHQRLLLSALEESQLDPTGEGLWNLLHALTSPRHEERLADAVDRLGRLDLTDRCAGRAVAPPTPHTFFDRTREAG